MTTDSETGIQDAIRAGLGPRSLVLVGLMGCGKSSVGKRLAARLGLPFVDADDEIVKAAGQSINEIFAEHGEAYFRDGERRVIQRILAAGPQVLATGGGAFMNEETRATIRRSGISIWLRADLPVLMRRVLKRDTRPLLKTGDPDVAIDFEVHRVREGKAWEHADGEEKKGHAHGAIDGHLWLDPDNAVAIVRVLVRELSALDKANAARYAANGEKAIAALKALDAELAAALAPLKGRRFVVAHDSTQYFERKYGLAVAGSIAVSPERPPSARRLADLKARIKRDNVVCVFGEPQHPDTLVKAVVEGTGARTGTLDTDGGIAVPEGPGAYAAIMRNLAKSLAACLAPAA